MLMSFIKGELGLAKTFWMFFVLGHYLIRLAFSAYLGDGPRSPNLII